LQINNKFIADSISLFYTQYTRRRCCEFRMRRKSLISKRTNWPRHTLTIITIKWLKPPFPQLNSGCVSRMCKFTSLLPLCYFMLGSQIEDIQELCLKPYLWPSLTGRLKTLFILRGLHYQ